VQILQHLGKKADSFAWFKNNFHLLRSKRDFFIVAGAPNNLTVKDLFAKWSSQTNSGHPRGPWISPAKSGALFHLRGDLEMWKFHPEIAPGSWTNL